ncbi:hypothetical protein HPP92_003390 [Vanilla planifolia]|uniref:CUE domain-containing protein n=1 Tax=Vanilla planifolia TaxID=51239 RepID=A0A835VFE9_VANPL|nr:hypothetical protein HPP92_003390 [Vanilla planifolia]
MSAGVCGKRVGFEEIFGSPASAPSAKRSRCSNYGSPIRAEFAFAAEDKVSVLLRMFPSMDRKVVEIILNSHENKIDDAIQSLHALCLGENVATDGPAIVISELQPNGHGDIINAEAPEVKAELSHNAESNTELKEIHECLWVDKFVQELVNASDWNDARSRAMKILESFEQMVVAHSAASKELEISSLKEQLHCLVRDNQILKRAVSIQHERNMEFEEKLKDVQQLKSIILQYQEQIRTLELNNYALKIHLQRAQEASCIPGRFHPDIF